MQARAQSAAAAALAHQRELLTEAIAAANKDPGNTRLQNVVCLAVTGYNTFAGLEGWPVFPVPAFCTAPAQEKK